MSFFAENDYSDGDLFEDPFFYDDEDVASSTGWAGTDPLGYGTQPAALPVALAVLPSSIDATAVEPEPAGSLVLDGEFESLGDLLEGISEHELLQSAAEDEQLRSRVAASSSSAAARPVRGGILRAHAPPILEEAEPQSELAAPTRPVDAAAERAEQAQAAASSSALLAEARFTTDLDFVTSICPMFYAMPEVYTQIYPGSDTNLDRVSTENWTDIFKTTYRDSNDQGYVSPMRTQSVDTDRKKKMPFIRTGVPLQTLAGDVDRRLVKAKAKQEGLVNRNAACRYTDVQGGQFRYRVRHNATVMTSSDGSKVVREGGVLRASIGTEGLDELERLTSSVLQVGRTRRSDPKHWTEMVCMGAMNYLDHVCPRYSISTSDIDYSLSPSEAASFPESAVRRRMRVNVLSPVWTVDHVPYLESDRRIDGVDTICCTLRLIVPIVYTAAQGHAPTRLDAVRAAQWPHVVLLGGQSKMERLGKSLVGKGYDTPMNSLIERTMSVALSEYSKNRVKKKKPSILDTRRVIFNLELIPLDVPYEENGETKWIQMPRLVISAASTPRAAVDSAANVHIRFRDTTLNKRRGQSFSEYAFEDVFATSSASFKKNDAGGRFVYSTATFMRYRSRQTSGRTLYQRASPPAQMVHEIYARYDEILHLARAREFVEHEFFVSRPDESDRYKLVPVGADEMARTGWRSNRRVSLQRLYEWTSWYEDDVGTTYSYMWGAGGVTERTIGRKRGASPTDPRFVHDEGRPTRRIEADAPRSATSIYSDANPLYAHMVVAEGGSILDPQKDIVDSDGLVKVIEEFDLATTRARLRAMVDGDAHMFLTGMTTELLATPFVDFVALGNNFLRDLRLPYVSRHTQDGPVRETDVLRSDAHNSDRFRSNVYACANFAYYSVPSILQWAHVPYMMIYKRRLGGLYMVLYKGSAQREDQSVDRTKLTAYSFTGKSAALSDYSEGRKGPIEPRNAAEAIYDIRDRSRKIKSTYFSYFFDEPLRKAKSRALRISNMPEEMNALSTDGQSVSTNYLM